MLGLFPSLYPDELLYSVLARYYVRSGYSNYVFAAEELFKKRSVRPDFEYLPALSDEVISHLTKNKSVSDILLSHTMFPYHCRFLPTDRKQAALESLIKMNSNYHDVVLYSKSKQSKTMRYCPECAKQDRQQYGETYWHRLHQIKELSICPLHHCYLVDTSFIISGKVSPNLIPTEMVIPLSESIILCENEKILSLADYIKEIFQMPIKMKEDLSVACVIKNCLENSKYRSPRGAVCRITHLYSDFESRYKNIIENVPKQWKIHKVITGQRFDFWDITLLSFFLGIKISDFQKITTLEKTQQEMFDEKIQYLRQEGYSYPKIAELMGYSVDTIKNAAYSKSKQTKPRKGRGGKPGRRPLDWESLDREMLPKVKEVIEKLRISKKPQRITVGGVARLVGLKSKRIDKLSLCKAEIERNYQTQEQHWARKVLWAWGVLQKKGKVITIKQIRLQTNMNAEQIKRALPNLLSINRDVYDGLIKMM